MTAITVNTDDSFEEWRQKTNQISASIAGITAINSSISAVSDTVTISTQSTERFRVDSIGNIGENVVPSAWTSTTKAFQMPAGSLYSTSTSTQGHAQNAYLSGTGWKYVVTGYASRYEQNSGKHTFYSAVSGSANANISWSQVYTIDVNGKVGIGISSMTYMLEIGASGVLALNDATNANKGTIQMVTGGLELYTGASKYVAIGTNTSERLRIDATGNVYVQTGNIYMNTSTTGIHSGSGAWPLIMGINGVEKMRIDSTGNILVGSTTVAYANAGRGLVEINGATDSLVGMRSGGTQIGYIQGTSTQFALNTNGAIPIVMGVNTTEKFRLDTSGNLLSTGGGYIGYSTGSGGAVTQLTNKSTAVTLNKPSGQITLNNAAIAANTVVAFSLSNSLITATDVVQVILKSGHATAGTYNVWAESTATGTCTICVKNISAGSLSEALVLNFVMIRGSAS